MSGKRRLFTIQIVVSLFVIGIIVYQLKGVNFNLEYDFTWVNVSLIILLVILSLLMRSIRWQYLMNFNSTQKITQTDSFKLLLVGSTLNLFMPAGSGDIAKSYFAYKWSGIKERILWASIYDKIIAISSLSILAFFSLISDRNPEYLLVIFLSLLPFLIVNNLNVLYKLKYVKRFLSIFKNKIDWELLLNIKVPLHVNLKSLTLSVFAWILTYLAMYLAFSIVKVNAPFTEILIKSPIITLGRLFPFTLNGIGTDEALLIYLFGNNKISLQEKVFMGALIYRFFMIIVPGIMGISILLTKTQLKPKQ